jgi:hypothetical protein
LPVKKKKRVPVCYYEAWSKLDLRTVAMPKRKTSEPKAAIDAKRTKATEAEAKPLLVDRGVPEEYSVLGCL